MKPMTRNTKKLVERARELGIDVPAWIEIRRTHVGHWQRSAGAWSWWACDADGGEIMGSPHTVSELLKAPKIAITSGVLHWGVELCPIYVVDGDEYD